METIMEVKHLSKKFGEMKAVDDINFQVYKGELFGFLGVNGAGKSTTINMLCTMYQQDQGTVSICGMDNRKEKMAIRKKIGVVFQNNTLDNRLTVSENLITRGCFYEKESKKVKIQLDNVVELLEIAPLLKRNFQDLSGGQKRRCEIARAVMNGPEVLFLDEPTTGLDPQSRKVVWDSIDKLRKEKGLTVFLTTHYMEEAAQAQHIGVIDRGSLVAYEQPHILKKQYASDHIKLIPSDQYSKQEIFQILYEEGIQFQDDHNNIQVLLEKTLDAIPILHRLKEKITSFEVIQGSMDDVFLNITGKLLEGGMEV